MDCYVRLGKTADLIEPEKKTSCHILSIECSFFSSGPEGSRDRATKMHVTLQTSAGLTLPRANSKPTPGTE